MLATLGGTLALLAGLALLLLPLLVPELSRPRDAFWGAVVLLLGLVLVTSAERLSGAPMLAVLCGGLLIGRLSTEVSQSRWRQLSEEERQGFWSAARWQTSLNQLGTTVIALGGLLFSRAMALGGWLKQRSAAVSASLSSRTTTAKPSQTTKRWVRPEPAGAETPTAPAPPAPAADAPEAPLAVVSDFAEVDARVRAALAADQDPPSVTETAETATAPDPAGTTAVSTAEPSAEEPSAAQESPGPVSPAAGAPAASAEPVAGNEPSADHDPETTHPSPAPYQSDAQGIPAGDLSLSATAAADTETRTDHERTPEPIAEPEPPNLAGDPPTGPSAR
jgi:hypothetical protein